LLLVSGWAANSGDSERAASLRCCRAAIPRRRSEFDSGSARSPELLQRGRLPGHEIVERLACSRDGESDDGGVIEKTKEGNFIGNKIERIDQITDCGDDNDESVLRNVPVFAAKISPDQPQHRL